MSIELSKSWVVFAALAFDTGVREGGSAYRGAYLDSQNTTIDDSKGGGEEWDM